MLNSICRNVALAPPPHPSVAHEQSAFAVIDPLYSSTALIPEPNLTDKHHAPWLYGESELECWRLSVLQKRMLAAELKVAYPGKWHTPANHVKFCCEMEPTLSLGDMISIRAVGDITVTIDHSEIYHGMASNEPHIVVVPKGLSVKIWSLYVDLLSSEGEPPSLLIESGNVSTTHAKWKWSDDGTHWSIPTPFPQTRSGVTPHRVELPEVTLRPESQSGEVVDFGRELLGRVVFSCKGQPSLHVGESIAEALSSVPAAREQSTELVKTSDGQWMSKHLLAFRYIRISGGNAKEVTCCAIFHPAQYRGAFACSDKMLTRIWMNSTYTLRLCMHDFLIDGIKRDRLPWAGDLAMSMMANAYSFADADIVRRSLTALGRAGISEKDINGIADYSLWWVIAQDLYQLYFADPEHLRREWPRVKDALECLKERCDDDGLLRPDAETWLFIDWLDVEKLTALQVLWWWAQISAAALAERMHDISDATEWRKRAETLSGVLYSKAWDNEAGAWRAHPDEPAEISHHANLLAIVSGLTKINQGSSIKATLLSPEASAVGTPYMKGFQCMALGRLGEAGEILSQIRSYWGGMLERDATTFWEAYNPEQKDESAYAFYGRPFAKSLCHAWSAGPTILLPSILMGIRPTVDGWKRFTVAPNLAGLKQACASVPTPYGDIRVEIDLQNVIIHVPNGTTLEFRQRSYSGPTKVSKTIKGK